MTKPSIYPTKRQKAFFANYDEKIEQYHLITSGSIMYFRHIFRLLILIYMVFVIVTGFELFSGLLVSDLNTQNKIVAPSMAGIMLVLTITMLMAHNQILLILGHGYKDHEAQLYVDRLTTKEECIASLKIVQSMFVIAVVTSLFLLWVLWGMYGTPFYDGQIGLQVKALKSILEGLSGGGMASAAQLFVPFLWVGTAAFFCALAVATLGWLQVFWAKKII